MDPTRGWTRPVITTRANSRGQLHDLSTLLVLSRTVSSRHPAAGTGGPATSIDEFCVPMTVGLAPARVRDVPAAHTPPKAALSPSAYRSNPAPSQESPRMTARRTGLPCRCPGARWLLLS